ncbi:unnamed protein product [Durusdinium trenchii]|uniref:Uncharacterized protein n=1 Tax=Durusdinium trenchii TaxID=1381693 RepID=A0ABP0MUQ5_9DINO
MAGVSGFSLDDKVYHPTMAKAIAMMTKTTVKKLGFTWSDTVEPKHLSFRKSNAGRLQNWFAAGSEVDLCQVQILDYQAAFEAGDIREVPGQPGCFTVANSNSEKLKKLVMKVHAGVKVERGDPLPDAEDGRPLWKFYTLDEELHKKAKALLEKNILRPGENFGHLYFSNVESAVHLAFSTLAGEASEFGVTELSIKGQHGLTYVPKAVSPLCDFWYSASSLQNASAVGLRANRVIEVLRGPETEHDLLLRAEKQRLQLLIGSAETDLSDLRKQLKAVEETLARNDASQSGKKRLEATAATCEGRLTKVDKKRKANEAHLGGDSCEGPAA